MLRSLLNNWQLNSIAVFSLAVAMALSVVAMSVSNTILLRPPYARDPGQLMTVYSFDRAHGGEPGELTYFEYRYLRDHGQSFSGTAALEYSFNKNKIGYDGGDQLVMENTVSDNYFEVMGIRPYLGRYFGTSDDEKHIRSAVLTYACWKRWGGDRKILGRTLRVGRQTIPIIGVAPKEFIAPVFALAADVILNFAADPALARPEATPPRDIVLMGRLRPGATRAQARAEVRTLWSQMVAAASPGGTRDRVPAFTGAGVLSPDDAGQARLIVAVMVAAALLILLIACANTANLLLALATLRRQEALIKTALGAPRRRLIGEFLRETVLLCAAGGTFGYVLAIAVIRWFSRFDLTVPPFGSFPIAVDLHPGTLVAACTAILIVGASLVSGLAPALYASRPNLASALSGEIAIGGTRRSWIRNTVVAVQVAVCTLALAGTGLCIRSLQNLRAVDPGFSARKIAFAFIWLDPQQVRNGEGRQLYQNLRRNAAAISGVEASALAGDLPLGGDEPDKAEVRFPGRPADGQKITIGYSTVDENYFAAMEIRLLEGRTFRPSASDKGPEEIIVNRFLANQYWPGQNAIGRTIELVEGNRTGTVVGIAADGKYADLDEPQRAFFYRPLDKNYQNSVTLIARTSADPRRWFDPLARAVKSLDIPLPLPPMSLDDWMNLTLFLPRVSLVCVSGLTVLAVLLAMIGLYGAISYSVRERRRELGIRIALGARPGQVMELVFRRTIAIAGTGVALGMGMGSAAAILFRSQLYRIHALEWTVLAPVALAMAAVSLAIAYAAARRWTRMSPMEAVRHI